MSYHDKVHSLADNAEQLESLYQAALETGDAAAFKAAVDDHHLTAPANLLYAAWYHRLKSGAAKARSFAVAWGWAIPLAVLNGLLFWWLSDEERYMIPIEGGPHGWASNFMLAIILLAGPLAALFVLALLAGIGRTHRRLAAAVGAILPAAAAYVLLTYSQAGTRPFQEQYLTLMALHLPLLAWAGVGVLLLAKQRDPANRFAFLIKSLEVFITGGLFVIAGGLFTGITVGLFAALNVEFPLLVQRLFIAGGAGLIPVLAVAITYNPAVTPAEQSFDQGLSRLVALLMRILLPLTLLVLLVYLGFIPFNFRAPFENRDVLIIYNGMLFAVVALLVGATPVNLHELSPRLARWLRLGICAVATLALLVSLYALAAILYRTALDRLTPNRLAFVGWNVVNIGLLGLVLFYQVRAKQGQWVDGLYRAWSAGTVAYAVWTAVMILALPWLFGINQGKVEALPRAVQQVIFENPEPILLKCTDSPHIYLLEKGEKRWVNSIETFEARGYVWRDVHFVTCNALRSVPDGAPIPADAGPPPQP